jgi:hypothetical protein
MLAHRMASRPETRNWRTVRTCSNTKTMNNLDTVGARSSRTRCANAPQVWARGLEPKELDLVVRKFRMRKLTSISPDSHQSPFGEFDNLTLKRRQLYTSKSSSTAWSAFSMMNL